MTTTTYSIRNLSDSLESSAWTCEAESSKDAAHKYLAEFWSAEQREDGSWYSPTYRGDIDGNDLSISVVSVDPDNARELELAVVLISVDSLHAPVEDAWHEVVAAYFGNKDTMPADVKAAIESVLFRGVEQALAGLKGLPRERQLALASHIADKLDS